MGRHDVTPELEPEAIRRFTRALLKDLQALERILDGGMIESGIRRFGAEQEIFLVDEGWRPAPVAIELLEKLDDPRFTSELALFNAEINLDPHELTGDCFSVLHRQLAELVGLARTVAHSLGAEIVMTGILPSLGKTDLSLDNLTPNPRYYALNEAISQMRGGPLRLLIQGTDELNIEHDSVMLESCNTSFQVHFQVDADEFVRYYNIAQAIAAPVLSAMVNSPILFGKRLWKETRIALFQQSIDTRKTSPHLRESSPRVRFGEAWLNESVIEAFQEDIARFRVILAADIEENPIETLDRGGVPLLKALQMHNSTVYRWNRPCYGITGGVPHLRIEARSIPAGPSLIDEVANAAFWTGLMLGAANEYGDVRSRLDFDTARTNFIAAARRGLNTQFNWLDGQSIAAEKLLSEYLLPLAREGLESVDVSDIDIGHYLDIIAKRVACGQTGARWILDSAAAMGKRGTRGERLAALTAATAQRQHEDRPVHEWALADLSEAAGLHHTYLHVEQFMTTDLFTVREDELVDLAAFLMDRKQIRHVLVEDGNHKLVGLISYRTLLRLIAHRGANGLGETLSAGDIMEKNPITITPATKTIDAILLMRTKKVSALPVIKDEKLVGIVSERDFMAVAGDLLSEKLRQGELAKEYGEE